MRTWMTTRTIGAALVFLAAACGESHQGEHTAPTHVASSSLTQGTSESSCPQFVPFTIYELDEECHYYSRTQLTAMCQSSGGCNNTLCNAQTGGDCPWAQLSYFLECHPTDPFAAVCQCHCTEEYKCGMQ